MIKQLLIIITSFFLVHGQISETYDHLSDKQMQILKKDLKIARNMTIAGASAHLGGLLLFFTAIPMFFSDQEDLAASFVITGSLGIYGGPALSCGGAIRAKRIYRRSDLLTMGKPRGWIYYGSGMALYIVEFIGTSVIGKEGYGYLFFAQEVLNIMAMVNSSRYVKDNQYKHAELSGIKLQISPIITFNKGVGLKLSAAF